MELFGRTLDAQQLAGLAFLLMTLVLWGVVARGQLREQRWIKRQMQALKNRRDAPKGPGHGGPWG